jgi:hypothetical protein
VTGRIVLVALGAVAALLGLVMVVAGGVLFIVTRGGVGGGAGTLRTDSYALVTDAGGLRAGGLEGTLRVRVTSPRGPVFVGVAPAATVDAYLAGVAHDDLAEVRLAPLRATPVPAGGDGTPARPADRPGWTVSATGPGERTVDVDVDAGGQKLVIMNADAAAGVEVTASLSLRAAVLRRLALGLLVAGVVAAPVGGVLLATAVWRTALGRAE